MIQQIFTVPIYEVDLEDIDNEAIYNFLKSEEQKHIGEEGSDEYNNYYKKELSILNKKEGGYHQEIFNKNLAQENNFSQQLFAREKGQFVLKNDNNETFDNLYMYFCKKILYLNVNETLKLLNKLIRYNKYLNVYSKIWSVIKNVTSSLPLKKKIDIYFTFNTSDISYLS